MQLEGNIFLCDARLEDIMCCIYTELKDKKPYYAPKVNAMAAELTVDVLRLCGAKEGRKEYTAGERFKNLLGEMEDNYSDMGFSSAALYMNMSEAYFSRYFKKMTGCTFTQYLNLLRISKAVALLHRNRDITTVELTSECGFNTIRNFNRVFREITGYSPSALPADYILDMRSYSQAVDYDPTSDKSRIIP